MNYVICPVCNQPLFQKNTLFKCENNHCFDKSKYGYVNLLMSQKSSKKRHGDDSMMVVARRDFLDRGYYQPLLDTVCSILKKKKKKNGVMLDTGCGEGYYTDGVKQALFCREVVGIDISKNALRYAAKRCSNAIFAVASIFHLPIADDSCDILLNLFAPHDESEFRRVLKENGVMIRVFPGVHHLYSLKEKIYDKVYENPVADLNENGFSLIESVHLKYNITIDNNCDIKNLFCMTPYYYKTSQKDQQKLCSLQTLTTEVDFIVAAYKKKQFH